MKYSVFPGCSLEKGAIGYPYWQSMEVVLKPLGVELVEVDDWNCCGATEYIALNRMAAYALIARTLALAAKTDGLREMVAPCSACYLNLSKADTYLTQDMTLAEKVNIALEAGGLHYKPGSVKTRHLLDVIVNDIGYKTIEDQVTKPLAGLRIAPYYGCLIGRPAFYGQVDDPEYPVTLDKLMRTLGAEVVDYPMKAHCCGGHMTQISEASAFDMIRRLVKGAADYKADLIVTVCPMCQMNLDGFQGAMNRYFKTDYHIPVLYFTQMMGLAFGESARTLGIGSEIVNARPALARIGVEVPPVEEEGKPVKKPRRAKEALPLPTMPGREEVEQ
ncbi:MAG: CoB--CoM heterodisulfide reductase iron-sulfur subunit B family protein [Anaerolineales bacterium]|nr:CoB--CoM heterodisulfide reductase iron-sulfur subunit B family protein [Anaerolineales bacterium]